MKRLITVGVLGAVVGGCQDGLSIDANLNAEAAVSFAVAGSPGLLGQSPPRNPIEIGAHTIAVSSAELRVSELALESANATRTEVRRSSMLLALPVNGGLTTPVNARLRAGSFGEFQMDVQKVRIRGSFDGQPFDVTLEINDELEVGLFPRLFIEENGAANLTVTVLMESWFRNSDGSAIDLRNLDATLESRLASNIQASFDAFEDDDRDGRQ